MMVFARSISFAHSSNGIFQIVSIASLCFFGLATSLEAASVVNKTVTAGSTTVIDEGYIYVGRTCDTLTADYGELPISKFGELKTVPDKSPPKAMNKIWQNKCSSVPIERNQLVYVAGRSPGVTQVTLVRRFGTRQPSRVTYRIEISKE